MNCSRSLTASVLFSVTMTAAPAAAGTIYEFTAVFQRNTGLPSFGVGAPSVNDLGVVAYMRTRPGGTAIVTFSGGSETIVHNGTSIVAPVAINNVGAIAVVETEIACNCGIDQLRRYNPDGSVTTLATADPLGNAELREIAPFVSINEAGQVAALVTLQDLTKQIRRFGGPEDPPKGTIIDTAGAARFNFTDPDINDAGIVAFKAQEPTAPFVSVFSGSGGAVTREGGFGTLLPGGLGSEAAINAAGLTAATQPGGIVTAAGGVVELIASAGPGAYCAKFSRLSLNDDGDVAFFTEVPPATGFSGCSSSTGGLAGIFFGNDPVADKLRAGGRLRPGRLDSGDPLLPPRVEQPWPGGVPDAEHLRPAGCVEPVFSISGARDPRRRY